ncbi:MAG: hypothetical protein H3C51_10870 [Rubellimicrobium sp.]|nr:hypothetical protein [Rubellimicrobium sp.]
MKGAVAALLLLVPAAGAGAVPFTLPEGCTAWLTIQSRGCSVSHHFTCAGDPEGWQRRIDFDAGGMVYFGTTDAETQWIESYHALSDHSERLEKAPADPASLTTLIETGIDTWDFRTLSPEIGATRYVGQDRLTGATETIDGVPLEVTEYAITAYDEDGAEIWRSEGQEYVSRAWRMFLSGVSATTVGTESWTTDDRPADFILPGEAGFLSPVPTRGCGVVTSGLPAGPDPAAPARR